MSFAAAVAVTCVRSWPTYSSPRILETTGNVLLLEETQEEKCSL